jgi:uncharacterized protein YecE (DUF72 family)
MKWHIGCSGFSYREWKDVFYPEKLPQRKWFEYYATHFDTLELNVTFYRFPQATVLQKWYDVSPEHFSFSVKAPRLITHYKQLNDCESLLDDFYTVVGDNLKDKTGCILFQFPPAFHYTPERLEKIIKNMRGGFKNVAEFRHPSWWQQQVYDVLGANKIVFSGISHPTLPDTPIINEDHIYYRFHGVPKLYYSVYDESFLQYIADEIVKAGKQEVYIYFNNTAAVGAIQNARWIKDYLKGR